MQTSTRSSAQTATADTQFSADADILLTEVLNLDCLSNNHLGDWSYSRVVGTDVLAPVPKTGVPLAPQMAGCRSESSKDSSCGGRNAGRTSSNGYSGTAEESASYVLVARGHKPTKTTVIDSFKVDFDQYRVLSKRRLVVFNKYYDICHASVSYINAHDQIALCITTCTYPEDPLLLSASWARTSSFTLENGGETPNECGLVSYRLYVHILTDNTPVGGAASLAQTAASSLMGKVWAATAGTSENTNSKQQGGGTTSSPLRDSERNHSLIGPPPLSIIATKEVTAFSQHPVSKELATTYISNICQTGYFLRQKKDKPNVFHLLACVDFHSITVLDLEVKLEKKKWEVSLKHIHQLARVPLWHHWDPIKQRLSFWSFMRPMYWLRVVQFSGDGGDKKDILKLSRHLQMLDEFTFGPPPLANSMPFGAGNSSTSTAFNITMLPIQYEHGVADVAMCHQVVSSGPPVLATLQRAGKVVAANSGRSLGRTTSSTSSKTKPQRHQATAPQKKEQQPPSRQQSGSNISESPTSPASTSLVRASREGSTAFLGADLEDPSSKQQHQRANSRSSATSIDFCEQALTKRNWEDDNNAGGLGSLVQARKSSSSITNMRNGGSNTINSNIPVCREIRCTITLLHNWLHRIELTFTLDNTNNFHVDKNERVSFVFSDGVIVALLPGVFVHFIDVSHPDQPPRYLFGVDLSTQKKTHVGVGVVPTAQQHRQSSSDAASTATLDEAGGGGGLVSKQDSFIEKYLHCIRNTPLALLQTGFGDCFFEVNSHRITRFALSKASVWHWIQENHLSANMHDIHGAIHLAVTHFGVSKREGEYAVSNLFQMLQNSCTSVKPSILCQVLIGECYCTVRERCYTRGGSNPYWSRIPMTDDFGLKDVHALTMRRRNVEAYCVMPPRQQLSLDCSGTPEQWWMHSALPGTSQPRPTTSFASFFKRKPSTATTKQRISLTGGIVRTSQALLSYTDTVANMLRSVNVPKEFADSLATHYNDVMSRLVQNVLQYDESIKPSLPPRAQLHFLHNLKISLLSLGYPPPRKFSDQYVSLALLHLPVSNVLEGIEAKLYAPTTLKLFQCYPLLQDTANESARDFGQSVLPIGAASPINPQYNIVNQWSSTNAKDINTLHRMSQRFVTSTHIHSDYVKEEEEEEGDGNSNNNNNSPSKFSRYLLETAKDDDALMACTFPDKFCENDPFVTGEKDWKDLEAVFELDRTEEEEEARLQEELSRKQESLYSIKRCFKEIGNPLDYHLVTAANCAVSSPAVPSAQRQEIMASIEPSAVVQFYRRHLPLDAPYGDYRPLRSFVESPLTLRSLHTSENAVDISTKRDRAAVMMMDALFPLVGECVFVEEGMMFY